MSDIKATAGLARVIYPARKASRRRR